MPAFIYEKRGRVAYMTLNRPEMHNAMNAEAWAELVAAWKDFRDDSRIWAAIITGAGKKAFCAGNDLKELAEWLSHPPDKRVGQPVPESSPMRGMPVWKPVIAAINGICTGTGLELAMACDIRIASDTARLGLAEVRQGVIPGNSGTQKIIRLMPFGRALELLFTGDFMDAQEALRCGLVNRVVPLDSLMSEAGSLAERICQNGPMAVGAVKELAYRGIDMNLSEGLRLETEMSGWIALTEDAKEGSRAFVEKRKPVWKGR
jgi:E-phenylitaconyl-CoA hydratase